VDTEPADAVAYVIRVPEKNGVSVLQPGTPVELTFDLSSVLLPVSATDVYLNIIYKNSGTAKTMAVGYNDISEPTPIDIFNNTDYVCVGGQWYPAGDPAAIAKADQLGNHNGFDDDIDSFRHNLSDLYAKASSTANPVKASATVFDFLDPGPLPPATLKRMGYILTDYAFKYSFLPTFVHIEYPRDAWTGSGPASLDTGMAVKSQTGSNNIHSYPLMYNMRGKLMWGGGGIVYNFKFPNDSICQRETLPPAP
ncbi:MAG: hypothetical protein WC007_07870, partial [Pelobacteraceae bacterium]